MKIKLSYIDLLLLMCTIDEWPFWPHKLYTLLKYCVLTYLFIRYIPLFLKNIKDNKVNRIAVFMLFIFGIVSVFSTLSYTNKFTWGVSALMNAVNYLVYFSTLHVIVLKRGTRQVLKIIFTTLLVALLINDSLIFGLRYDFVNSSEQYLIGNKFSVSYYHCLLVAIAKAYSHLYKGKSKYVIKRLPNFLAILAVLIAAIVHCSTGLIISVVSLLMINLPEKIKTVTYNRIAVGGVLFVENFLIFGSAQLFTHPAIQYFFVNLLGKTSNMTGRFRIYNVLDGIIAQKPLFGYGFNTVTDIVTGIVKYGNAQNGIKQLLIEFGIIGTALLLFSSYLLIGKNNNKHKDVLELYTFIFALVIASMVEISLSSLFVFAIALVSSFNNYYEKKEK